MVTVPLAVVVVPGTATAPALPVTKVTVRVLKAGFVSGSVSLAFVPVVRGDALTSPVLATFVAGTVTVPAMCSSVPESAV